MSEIYPDPWIAVGLLMEDNYREAVVAMALRHLPAASPDLRRFAHHILTRGVSIPGFRSMDRAPVVVALPHVIKRMHQSNDVVTAVICLWAEVQQPLIDVLRAAAEAAEVRLLQGWSWQQACFGCCSAEEVLKPLADLVDGLAQGRPAVDGHHLRLAAYWLSGAAWAARMEGLSAGPPPEEPPGEPAAEAAATLPVAALSGVAPLEPSFDDLPGAEPALPAPVETVPAPPEAAPPVPTTPSRTLAEWVQELLGHRDAANLARQAALDASRALLEAAESADTAHTEGRLAPLQSDLAQWGDQRGLLREAMRAVLPAVLDGLQARPDLDPDQSLAAALHTMATAEATTDDDVERLQAVVGQLGTYDREKHSALEKLDAVLADIAELQTEAGEWLGETSPQTLETMAATAYPLDSTLRQACERLARAEAELHRLKSSYTQWIDLCQERIATLAETLQEGGTPGDAALLDKVTLDDILSGRYLDLIPAHMYLLPRQLERLEKQLVELVEEQARTRAASVPATAGRLRTEWSDEELAGLLLSLAGEKRRAEAVLLLLAANAVHPRAARLALPGPVVEGLWRGIEQLAAPGRALALLNQLAMDFGTRWAAAEPAAQARLCLAWLGAAHAGEQRLPEAFLFELAEEWPLAGMTAWQRLWQAATLEEALPAIVRDDEDPAAVLRGARAHTARLLAHEGTSFVTLRSLQSRRHYQLLNSLLLPEMAAFLSALQDKEEHLARASRRQRSHVLADLEKHVSTLGEELSEAALERRYHDAVQEAGMPDRERYHQAAALRVLQECGAAILEYGRALLASGRAQADRRAPLTSAMLLGELGQVPELAPLGREVLERIVEVAGTARSPWDEGHSRSSAYRNLTRELLSRPAYALRLPRVSGYLAGAPFDWAGLLVPLLDDLAEPLEPAAAAALLLAQRAPNQVLLLTQHISVDLQKQAQAMAAEEEREYGSTQTEVLKVGGAVEDLADDRKLGRWRLVRQSLSKRLAAQQEARQAERLRIQGQANRLRRLINDRDQALFEAKETMPADAYGLAEQGLNLARQAIGNAASFAELEAYLQELDYRLEHRSWPLAELEDAVGRLEHLMASETVAGKDWKAAEVLDLLERGELRQLALRAGEIEPSEIGTRIDLLRSWLAVRSLPAFLSEGLNLAQRRTIQSLFRYFAQMTALKHVEAQDGSPLEYVTPVVYSHWKLKYPQTTVLEDSCVLLALPGQPPASRNLKEVEYLLNEKDWLGEYGWFVFLFVPGCTAPIHKRLQSANENRGLVVIDEPTLLGMVLAEAESRQPLGRLRSLMLNSRGAENVDVFKTNQLVQRRTAIFVGREPLINRLATSGNSYALYGGRRIGKSSVLKEVEERLRQRGVTVVSYAFEGNEDFSDNASAQRLARLLGLAEVSGIDDFKAAMQDHLDGNPDSRVVLLLDETDQYIVRNPDRHGLVEVLRNLADRYSSRFCLVMAGFMDLYRCLQGRGPYTPTSDPWRRMLNDIGPLKNLSADQAERIVQEGFVNILGWQFENRAIPQWIVEHTGGHPAFVQYFCLNLQHRVARRRDHCIRLEDAEAVFADREPEHSFIAYVRKTLEMNLDPLGRYVILWLAKESSEARSFTRGQAREIADMYGVTEVMLDSSLERLKLTSVIEERSPGVYEFSVPDYPLILDQMGDTADMGELEAEIAAEIQRHKEAARGKS